MSNKILTFWMEMVKRQTANSLTDQIGEEAKAHSSILLTLTLNHPIPFLSQNGKSFFSFEINALKGRLTNDVHPASTRRRIHKQSLAENQALLSKAPPPNALSKRPKNEKTLLNGKQKRITLLPSARAIQDSGRERV